MSTLELNFIIMTEQWRVLLMMIGTGADDDDDDIDDHGDVNNGEDDDDDDDVDAEQVRSQVDAGNTRVLGDYKGRFLETEEVHFKEFCETKKP